MFNIEWKDALGLGDRFYCGTFYYPSFEKLLMKCNKPKIITTPNVLLEMCQQTTKLVINNDNTKEMLNKLFQEFYKRGITEETNTTIKELVDSITKISIKDNTYFFYGVNVPIEIMYDNQLYNNRKILIVEKEDNSLKCVFWLA